MKNQILSGAALAALIVTGLPFATSAARAETPSVRVATAPSSSIETFYAARPSASLWLAGGQLNAGGSALVDLMQRASLDGFNAGPAIAQRANGLVQRAASGDHQAAVDLEKTLSSAWVQYVQTIQQRTPGMDYADAWAAPRQRTAAQILGAAATSGSLADHVATVSAVNPVYAQLRADVAQRLAPGDMPDESTMRSLAQARTAPSQGRYIMVDAESANLWMIEDGRIAGTMKVITGDDANQTPMIASTIYQATLNPYWNVPTDLAQKLIAPRVASEGLGYLKERNYEVLSDYNGSPIDPATVNWKSVVDGSTKVIMRRKPGKWNSMGQMKFGFPNDSDIFLHDTPDKSKFALEDRNLSHGCIRLSDALALARWLLDGEPDLANAAPEQVVTLPKPVPIYVTHLNARVENGRIALNNARVGAGTSVAVASLR